MMKITLMLRFLFASGTVTVFPYVFPLLEVGSVASVGMGHINVIGKQYYYLKERFCLGYLQQNPCNDFLTSLFLTSVSNLGVVEIYLKSTDLHLYFKLFYAHFFVSYFVHCYPHH